MYLLVSMVLRGHKHHRHKQVHTTSQECVLTLLQVGIILTPGILIHLKTKISPKRGGLLFGCSSSFNVTVMKSLLELALTIIIVIFVVVFTFTGESVTSILSQNSVI